MSVERDALLWARDREGQPTLDRTVWIDLEKVGFIKIDRRGRVSITERGNIALDEDLV